MSALINKSEEEISIGDQILFIELFVGEQREILSEVVDIRYILGRPTYLVETESGKRKLVGDHQILRAGYSE